MTSIVEFNVLDPFILLPGERQEITGTIFVDGIEPQITSVGLQNWSGYYQVDERTYKYIFGEYIDLYSDDTKLENIDITATPFNSEYQFEVAYPSFAMTDRLGDSIPFELRWWIGHDGTFSGNIETIGEITYAQQLLPSPDILSVSSFSAEQILNLGKYIQSTTHNIALKSYETDDLESTTRFEFVYIPTTNDSQANHDITWRSYREHPDKPALFELIIIKENIEPISPESLQIISNAYEDFVESDSTTFWHEQIQFQREAKNDKDFLLFQTANGTYGFLNDHSHFGPGQLLKFQDGFDFESLNELNGSSERKWYAWWHDNKENRDVFAWAMDELVGAYTEYLELSNAYILFYGDSNGEVHIFNETTKEITTFIISEEEYTVGLADAVITDDDNLLLLVSGNDGVGGNHYFAKLYDLTGTHLKTVLLSNNGYDGSLVKLDNDQFGIIIDTTFQTISSDLSSFSLPLDLNIDAWSTTITQQFSEQLIKVAKFNGGDNWFNDLLWINTELTESDDIYFGDQAGATISTLGGC